MHFRNQKKTSQDIFINDTMDIDKDGNTMTLMDKITDKTDIQNEIELKIKLEEMNRILQSALTDREREILILRYGLFQNIPLTQKKIAKKLNISRSYVSRIETKALEKLKRQLESSNLS